MRIPDEDYEDITRRLHHLADALVADNHIPAQHGQELQSVLNELEHATTPEPFVRLVDVHEDHSTTNPKLHALYTYWAHHHLLVLGKCIKKLDTSNSNWSNGHSALFFERQQLIKFNTAYRDAAALIVAGITPEDPHPQHSGDTDEVQS